MATFEENILAYLDGSLAEDQREELLRAVSNSPDKRRLLDAHIRLRDLLANSERVQSAPLLVQRELAEKLPFLAARIPALAGAATGIATSDGALGASATGGVAQWFSSLSSSRLSALLIGGAVVIGGTYYAATHSSIDRRTASVTHSGESNSRTEVANHNNSANSSSTATSHPGGNQSALRDQTNTLNRTDGANRSDLVDQSNSATQSELAHKTTDHSKTLTNNQSAQTSSSHAASNHHQALAHQSSGTAAAHSIKTNNSLADNAEAPASHQTSTAKKPTNSKAQAAHSNKDLGLISDPALDQPTRGTVAHQSNSKLDHSSNSNLDHTPNSSLDHQSDLDRNSTTTADLDKQTQLPLTAISSIDAKSIPVKLSDTRSTPIKILIDEKDETYTPIRTYAFLRARMIVVPGATKASEHLNSIAIKNGAAFSIDPMIALDYELSPWASLTARVGYTHIAQIQPVRYSEKISNYAYLQHNVNDAAVVTTQVPTIESGVGYLFNPGSALRVSGYVTAGVAVVNGVSPIGSIDLSGIYDLSNSIMLRAGVGYDMSRVKPANVTDETSPSSLTTTGEVSRGVTVAPLTAGAFSVSFGLQFHP